MSLATHGFDLPIMPGSISPVLNLSQYDDARTFTAHLKDENGNAFTLPNGASAKLEGMNYKGVTFEINATPSGSDITFTPKEAATDQPGLIAATLHIKNGNENISTLAVILNVQKAGATKEEQARSPGFTDAIQAAVEAWASQQGFTSPTVSITPITGGNRVTFTDAEHPQGQSIDVMNGLDGEDGGGFELPEGGEEGQALISDGEGGAEWGAAQGGGSGLTEDVKQALLACFANVAWIGNDGQDYYDDLNDALYPPANLSSISAAFNPQSHIVYVGDSLDSLKPYLAVTAHYSDQSTRTVSDYLLSGTLAEGTSVITVTYGGKTTTFNVTVIAKEWESGVPYKNIQIVMGEWPQTQTGVMNTNSSTWSRSDYVPCAGAKRIYFPLINSASNWFYNANYEPLPRPGNTPNFPLYNAQTYNVPEGAAYFVISGANAEIAAYFDDNDCIPYDSY